MSKKRSEAAVAAIITDDRGRALVTQRDREPKAGIWHLIGGGVEPREHHVDALLREIEEEIGVRSTLRHDDPVAVTSCYFPDVDRHVVCIYFDVQLLEDNPRPMDGTRAVRWCDEREVRELIDAGVFLETCRLPMANYLGWESLRRPPAVPPAGSPAIDAVRRRGL